MTAGMKTELYYGMLGLEAISIYAFLIFLKYWKTTCYISNNNNSHFINSNYQSIFSSFVQNFDFSRSIKYIYIIKDE